MANTWASQAALNSLLKNRPARLGLADLRREARAKYVAALQAGQSEGRLAGQAAQAAIPQTRQLYDQAAAQDTRAQGLTAPVLSMLGPTNPFVLAAANESTAGSERLAGSKAHALSDLQARKVAARALPGYTRQAALASLGQELQQITGKSGQLDATEGADTQAGVNTLRHEAQVAEGEERRSLRSQLTSENNSKRSAAARQTGAAKPLLTQSQINTGAKVIGGAVDHAKGYLQEGKSRQEVAKILAEGEPAFTHEGEKVPAVPAVPRGPLLAAVLDWAEYGKVTIPTQRALHGIGYTPGKLGIPLVKRGRGGKGVTGGVLAPGKKRG